MDFEDVRLTDLLNKVERRAKGILESRKLSEVKLLGADVQAVYNFFITAQNAYEKQQPMLKNMFSSFNYAAVIVNDAIKKKTLDSEANELLGECLQIIISCCSNIKNSL